MGQWAQAGTYEVPYKHEEKILYFDSGKSSGAGCPEMLQSLLSGDMQN